MGAEGVARALGGVWGAVDVPQAPAAAVVPAASPPKPAKKMTKKALKEQQAAAAAAAGMGMGTGAGVAPGAQPMQAMQGVGGALTHRGSPAYDLQHQLFLQQQQQHQQQGGQLRRVNSALGPNDFELASGPLGMGASAPMPGVVPPLTAAEKKAAGAKRKREAKAAAAKAAKVAGLSGAPTAQPRSRRSSSRRSRSRSSRALPSLPACTTPRRWRSSTRRPRGTSSSVAPPWRTGSRNSSGSGRRWRLNANEITGGRVFRPSRASPTSGAYGTCVSARSTRSCFTAHSRSCWIG